ncbi:MAG: hypothetical protein DDT33_00881 [Firmicutes bacterium]|nr:hypothetical protein [Bacillota bacterium]
MGFREDIAGIKGKKILFLLGGGVLLLMIILLLPAGERRGSELPLGFERAALPEVRPLAPVAPLPVVGEVFLCPQLLKEARKRYARGWGPDPFLLAAAEVGYVRLHLGAIFLGVEKSAIINGKALTIGDKIGGYEITGIAKGVVTLEKKGLTRQLSFW